MIIEYPGEKWRDYELVDCGRFEKLERFGEYYLWRPEPKAIWDKSLLESDWERLAHTKFRAGAGFGKAGKEDSGTWERVKRTEDRWFIKYGAEEGPRFDLRLGLTSFKHVGVFPEQAGNWDYIFKETSAIVKKGVRPRVLNLFAYTGAASLAAKAAGAEVSHLDSVRQVITWARENMERSRMDGIKWILEDALKFARREAKRGNKYNGIILDPPAYGHGPNGETWKLDECLFDILKCVASILEDKDSFMVLNLYSNGFTASLGETAVKEAFGLNRQECPEFKIQSGESALRDRFGKVLPLSVFVRLKR